MGRSKRMKSEKRKMLGEASNMDYTEMEFELINCNDSMEDFLEK